MILLMPLMLMVFAAPIHDDPPQTYLLSLVDVPLAADESIEAFTLSTWGVTFTAVCQIPTGWTIKAGGSVTPSGLLEGEGSNGVSWLPESSPPELRNFVLVTLHRPVQTDETPAANDSGEPPTFIGSATISTVDGEKQIRLTAENIRLKSADRCTDQGDP